MGHDNTHTAAAAGDDDKRRYGGSDTGWYGGSEHLCGERMSSGTSQDCPMCQHSWSH